MLSGQTVTDSGHDRGPYSPRSRHQRLRSAGSPQSKLIGTSHPVDILLPLADANRRELRIRCMVRADPESANLVERLGLTLQQ